MKSENEVREVLEKIRDKWKHYGRLDDYDMGWKDALEWVLEIRVDKLKEVL